jgi:hypothetical protein
MACYCQGLSFAARRGHLHPNYNQATIARTHCESLTAPDSRGMLLFVAICAIIVAVNAVLNVVIRRLVLFERHVTHSNTHRSQCVKAAVA